MKAPPDKSDFVGRSNERRELEALIASGARLVTLVGPPGVGKSRLLLEVASAAEAPVSSIDLSDVRDVEAARRALRERALTRLVVLDNAEGIAPFANETIGAWIRETRERELVLLVSSREPLFLAGERAVRLAPLNLDDAIALLTMRARLASGDPSWGEESEDTLRALVDKLDRLPLSLVLAAERASVLSATTMLEAASDPLRLLRTKRRDAGPRERSLEESLELSFRSLSSSEREALARLAVLAGDFSIEAAAAVLASEDALDVLEGLVDKSLVDARRGEKTRFALLAGVRAYAGRTPHAEAERLASAFFFRLAGAKPPDDDLPLELDNILGAHARALGTDPVAAARALLDLEPLLAQRRPLSAIAALLAKAAEHVTAPAIAARLRIAEARTLRRMGHEALALAKLEAARTFALEDGDPSLLASVAAGLAASEPSKEQRAAPGDPLRLQASTQVFDAVTVSGASGEGALEAARRACERTLTSLRRSGSRRSEGVVLTRLASVLLRAGDVEAALSRAEEALEIHHELGAAAFEGVSSYVAGLAETKLGEASRAAERFLDVHARAEEIDSPLLRGYAHHGDGVLAIAAGHEALAIAELETAASELTRGGDLATRSEVDELLAGLKAGASKAPSSASSPAHVPGRRLRVSPTWFELDGGERVDLARRRALRLLLRAVAEHSLSHPGTALKLSAVISAAWPGERILATAASARVWTAVRTLRDLGLRDVLVTQDDGYAVEAGVRVELE